MSSLPHSHAKPNLDLMPVVNGSVLYAVLTAVGLACVCGARCAKLLEPKEVGMSLVFVVTAGVCMWLVYLATWMHQWHPLMYPTPPKIE